MTLRRPPAVALPAILSLAGALAGCSSPLDAPAERALRDSIAESARRELRAADARPAPIPLHRDPTDLEIPPDRLAELEEMAGPGAYQGVAPSLGDDLTGAPTTVIAINLRDAVTRAVHNNLAVQAARLTPAITEAQLVAAEAAFDWILFGSISAARFDEPTIVPVINGIPVSSAINQRQTYGFETGVRKLLTSGATLDISQSLNITNNENPDIELFPDPARRASIDISLGQPLLRGFGADATLAEVRLAQNLERDAIQALRAQLIDTVTAVERAYWGLVLARANLLIRERLLERGVETRDILKGRLDFDVRPAEYSDAVARVSSRRSDVIRAVSTVRQRSDELKALINDPGFTVGDEIVLAPLDTPAEAPVEFSLLDSLTTAVAHRPDIHRAAIAVDDAGIRQRFAASAALPLLDLAMQASFIGLDDDAGDAYDDAIESRFVNLLLALNFEYPLGNRAGEALERQRRLERVQAVVNYRAAVQNSVLAVKTALRNIRTNFQLIDLTRASRLAAAENLRTLLVEEQNIRALTPDFLDLKLRRQEALALAELEEALALTDYNIALAELYAAMGSTLQRNRINFIVPAPGEEIPESFRAADVNEDAR